MKLMPDISHESSSSILGRLHRVGMENIEIPILWQQEGGPLLNLPASIDAFVSLDKESAKGIHMSRLYLALADQLKTKPISFSVIESLLSRFVQDQKGLSETSELKIRFALPILRKALVSETSGWRQYNVEIGGHITDSKQIQLSLSAEVVYSSTCPCSAALSRQLVKEKFLSDHSVKGLIDVSEVAAWLERESSIVATPHAQRSHAQFTIQFSSPTHLSIVEVLNGTEKALGTPVQASVKREDEQEFARLNGSQLMFCEDAGRKLQKYFENLSGVSDFWAKLSHRESLHPHDAVCIIRKSGGQL